MRFQIVVIVAFALLICVEAISTFREIDQAKISSSGLSEARYSTLKDQNKRSLRTPKVADAVEESAEEKGLWTWIKVNTWLDLGLDEAYALKKLKLSDLDDEAMKLDKNYKYYKYFSRKFWDYKISSWLRKDITPWNVWKNLKLHEQITVRKEIGSIENTREFNLYRRYVKSFGNRIRRTLKGGNSVPYFPIPGAASDAELYARVRIMALERTEDQYAKVLLGLTDTNKQRTTTLTGTPLTQHADYHWFELFQKLRKEVQNEAEAAAKAAATAK
ncbi:RxLR effector protein [Phytophthora megakarya]|uniref:RxLR effector protein n=1 Tax=Phytophthora megakarya TaxID=4795 RepID=A0A225WNQ1_9STRA|nr:RxLR effector protein [Phytophthora megakarya]